MDKEKKKFLRRRLGWWSLRLFSILSAKSHLEWSYFLGSVLGKLAYLFVIRHRRIALESLSIAFPHLKQEDRKILARDFFVFMSQSSLEIIYFIKNPRALESIRIEGKEFLDEALKNKNGVIGLTAHLGNFPLMSFKFARLGYSISVLVRPMRDEKAGDYIHNLRIQTGVKSIFSYPRKECVNQTIEALRDNGIVLIQMDQNFGTGGVWVKFFDKLAATPVGPIIFALRTKAKVLPMYIVREGLGRHCIKILPPLDLDMREDKDETILLNAIKFTKVIEHWVKEQPSQWGWVHRRWKSKPSKKIEGLKFRMQKD